MRRLLLALACVLPLLAAGCDDPAGSRAPSIESTTFAPALGVDLGASTRTSAGFYLRDLTVGTGDPVTAGNRVFVRYTAWLSNGTEIDTNRADGKPLLDFVVGGGRLIPGFELGVVGMRVGGRRQLVLPPSLAYGAQRYGAIPGNSIMVFDIELTSAQ